jgi:6-phosphogluconolactonase
MTFTKTTRYALVASAFAILVMGCGGPQPTIGAQGPPLDGLTRTGAITPGADGASLRARPLTAGVEFLYALERHHIDAFTIDTRSGALAKINGSPFGIGGPLQSIVLDPAANYLYVTYGGVDHAGGIDGFSIDPNTGALKAIGGFGIYSPIGSIAITPNGGFLYTGNPILTNGGLGRGGIVVGYSIDSSTGALKELSGSPFSTGGTGAPNGIVITPSGSFLYADQPAYFNGFAGETAGFSIDPSSGALTKSPGNFAKGVSPNSAVVAPSGGFLYLLTSENGGTIHVYEIHLNGSLEETPGSPYSAPGRAYSMAITPSGKYAYVTTGDEVLAFSVNRRTGGLTQVPGSPYAVSNARSAVVDLTGKFLFVAAGTNIAAYQINASNGSLTPITGVGGPYHGTYQVVVAAPH